MQNKRKRSDKQDRENAKLYGGRPTTNSGATPWQKGDWRTDIFLIEDKYTDEDFYILTTRDWNKIKEHSIKDSLRLPLMQITISGFPIVVFDHSVSDSYPSPASLVLTTNKKQIRLKVNDLKESLSTPFAYVSLFIDDLYLYAMMREDFFSLYKTTSPID